MPTTRRSLAAALVVAALVPTVLTAQRSRDRDRDRERERDRDFGGEDVTKIDTTFTFGPNGTVDLSQVSGNITVTASRGREAKVYAFTEYGTLRADFSGSRIVLEVRSRRGRMGESEFRLQLPAGTRVLARSVSGEVSVTGMKAAVEARSVSGSVHVEDATDRVSLESVSGDVTASGIAGALRATSVSGDLKLTGVAGDLELQSVSGEVVIHDARSGNVRAETVSGSVEYQGSLDKAGRYEFKSHSGDVTLTLPDNLGANFSLSTFSGSVDSAIPMTLQPSDEMTGRRRSKTMEFSVGGGGARITVSTFSGDVTIQKAGQRARQKREE